MNNFYKLGNAYSRTYSTLQTNELHVNKVNANTSFVFYCFIHNHKLSSHLIRCTCTIYRNYNSSDINSIFAKPMSSLDQLAPNSQADIHQDIYVGHRQLNVSVQSYYNT